MARYKKKGVVNHPPHYLSDRPIRSVLEDEISTGTEITTSFEAADVIEGFAAESAHRAHTLTYLLRAGRKQYAGLSLEQSRVVDLQKARWWIDREIRFLGGEIAD